MQVIGNEMNVMFDCDDTLVLWDNNYSIPSKGKIELEDPYTSALLYLKPHAKHIELMKSYKARGYSVFVWSAGGKLWAEEVVKRLQIKDIVDHCMSKPTKFVDDLPAEEVLGTRVYLKDTSND